MKTFTIENETGNITIHSSAKDAEGVLNPECFSNEAGFENLAADWPAARLIDIWNSLPGAAPVKKFQTRAVAVARIWKALQSLGETVPAEAVEPEAEPIAGTAQEAEVEVVPEATQEPEATPEPEPLSETPEPAGSDTTEGEVPTPVTPQTAHVATEQAPAKKDATRAKKTPATATEAGLPREGSKTSQVIAMLKREGGTTLEEIMTTMGWQKHTARAMLSAGGSLTKNHGLVVTSEKVGEKRIYSIKG